MQEEARLSRGIAARHPFRGTSTRLASTLLRLRLLVVSAPRGAGGVKAGRNFAPLCEPELLRSLASERLGRSRNSAFDGTMAGMNYKKRVHKRYPDAKLVKNAGEKETYAVKSGDIVLCEAANSPTDAWRQAATFLDRPYGPRPGQT
jgi:hypothetical protein